MAAFESNLNEAATVVVQGVKGAKSKSFQKKFKNFAAYMKWTDTDAFHDYEVQYIFNA